MRTLLTTLAAGLLAVSFTVSADAATKKKKVTSIEASCKAQAAKKYSAIHFMKRRDYVKRCVGQTKA